MESQCLISVASNKGHLSARWEKSWKSCNCRSNQQQKLLKLSILRFCKKNFIFVKFSQIFDFFSRILQKKIWNIFLLVDSTGNAWFEKIEFFSAFSFAIFVFGLKFIRLNNLKATDFFPFAAFWSADLCFQLFFFLTETMDNFVFGRFGIFPFLFVSDFFSASAIIFYTHLRFSDTFSSFRHPFSFSDTSSFLLTHSFFLLIHLCISNRKKSFRFPFTFIWCPIFHRKSGHLPSHPLVTATHPIGLSFY